MISRPSSSKRMHLDLLERNLSSLGCLYLTLIPSRHLYIIHPRFSGIVAIIYMNIYWIYKFISKYCIV